MNGAQLLKAQGDSLGLMSGPPADTLMKLMEVPARNLFWRHEQYSLRYEITGIVHQFLRKVFWNLLKDHFALSVNSSENANSFQECR